MFLRLQQKCKFDAVKCALFLFMQRTNKNQFKSTYQAENPVKIILKYMKIKKTDCFFNT
jgi:hypothetical protein